MLNNIVKIRNDEFNELRDIIYKNSAITFMESKKYLLENRLSKRLNELGHKTYKDYINYLKYDKDNKGEMERMINLVTINETYFLRERPQMDHLVKTTLPEMLAAGKKQCRIWSAACSTGEEPYSLAMLMTEAGLYNKMKIEIMATDINSDVVEFAKKGEYRSMSFRGTPEQFTKTYFTPDKTNFLIKPEIKDKVRFNTGNLTGPTIGAQMGKFDVIFCRNVLIYFDAETKTKVVTMFYNALNAPGYLYLGHSENISKLTDKFKVINFGSGLMHTKAK
ncbi:MAG: protein-glutamate O-methyltransferase CheR [Deferribacteraceae bacterium]|jgi:chemotaxis protein methyltransferase CheR|nr:protein-glutamate O-methyltransferase CheR [Deferribacteraceae bacterium]